MAAATIDRQGVPMKRLVVWLAVSVLGAVALAAGCGGDDSTSDADGAEQRAVAPALGEVRRIESILDGPIQIVGLDEGNPAVELSTTIEVMCSVVYGPDESYGQQSTDPGMGGFPHDDHSAPLRGLQPDTVYHYRLQGTGPDGAIYVSSDMTFRTPPAASSADEGPRNLASAEAGARVVDVSSEFGGAAWAGANAIDGDPQTAWSSASDGDEAFITVEIAEPSAIGEVGLWTRTMGTSAQITSFRVITDDGTVLGPFDVPAADRLYTFPVDVTAMTLRFEAVSSSGGNTGAIEVAAFAAE